MEIGFNCFTFSESGDLPSPPPAKQKVGCKGCDFDKGSLRGHLARTTKGCKNLYTAEELKELEMAAEEAKRQRIAEWKVRNREANREGIILLCHAAALNAICTGCLFLKSF